MATIDELMEDKKPGEIKVVENGDFAQFYFVPYFKDRTGQWNGLIEGDCFCAKSGNSENWHIYTEPKKKVKRWLWTYKLKYPNGDYVWDVILTLRSEEEILELILVDGEKESLKKIPGTEMEFEE